MARAAEGQVTCLLRLPVSPHHNEARPFYQEMGAARDRFKAAAV